MKISELSEKTLKYGFVLPYSIAIYVFTLICSPFVLVMSILLNNFNLKIVKEDIVDLYWRMPRDFFINVIQDKKDND